MARTSNKQTAKATVGVVNKIKNARLYYRMYLVLRAQREDHVYHISPPIATPANNSPWMSLALHILANFSLLTVRC